MQSKQDPSFASAARGNLVSGTQNSDREILTRRPAKAQRPKSIKIAGLIISIIACFIIFSNGMGALAWAEKGMYMSPSSHNDPVTWIFANYVECALIMVILGTTLFIGGVFIRQHNLWANKLVTGLSALKILIVWSLSIAIMLSNPSEIRMFNVAVGMAAVFWSAPFLIIILYLNNREIKKYFH